MDKPTLQNLDLYFLIQKQSKAIKPLDVVCGYYGNLIPSPRKCPVSKSPVSPRDSDLKETGGKLKHAAGDTLLWCVCERRLQRSHHVAAVCSFERAGTSLPLR